MHVTQALAHSCGPAGRTDELGVAWLTTRQTCRAQGQGQLPREHCAVRMAPARGRAARPRDLRAEVGDGLRGGVQHGRLVGGERGPRGHDRVERGHIGCQVGQRRDARIRARHHVQQRLRAPRPPTSSPARVDCIDMLSHHTMHAW